MTPAGQTVIDKVAALAGWTTNDELVAEITPLILAIEAELRRSLAEQVRAIRRPQHQVEIVLESGTKETAWRGGGSWTAAIDAVLALIEGSDPASPEHPRLGVMDLYNEPDPASPEPRTGFVSGMKYGNGGNELRPVASVSVSVVMPSGHTHTLSHVRDFDADQTWDCGTAHITVKDGHLVTVATPVAGSTIPEQEENAVTVQTPDVPAGGFSQRERIANVVHLLVIGAQSEAETIENIERTISGSTIPDRPLDVATLAEILRGHTDRYGHVLPPLVQDERGGTHFMNPDEFAADIAARLAEAPVSRRGTVNEQISQSPLTEQLEAALERERDLRQERVETAHFHVAHDGSVRHPETCNDCRALAERGQPAETPR